MADISSNNTTNSNYEFNGNLANEVEIFVICSLGIALNVFVTLILLKYRENGGIINILLVNLSVIDLLVSLLVILLTIFGALKSGLNRSISSGLGVMDVICKISLYGVAIASFCSTYILATLAIERYRAICYPLNSRNYHQHYNIAIVISWFISFVSSAYTIALSQYEPYFYPYVCFLKGLNYAGSKIWVLLSYAIGYGVPVFVTICCYVTIAYKFIRSIIQSDLPDMHTTYIIKRRKEMQTVTILLIITITSFIPKCLLFIFTNILTIEYATSLNNRTDFISNEFSTSFKASFFRIISLVTLAQVIVNPLLYNFVSRKFREKVYRYITIALGRLRAASS
ncbi:Somatostatin receptor type 4 [Trichoplax sp. H2]|nr:Somatostatin receptor type 4 [Trichoplax sp. H2]|eukprot:RDD36766.1 Somatostatin receptor type 4 [Trichoplax sp. H2]